jgi:serine/threonine protein kinase
LVKGGLNLLTGGVAGEVFDEVWKEWHRQEAQQQQKRDEVREIITASKDEVRRQIGAAVTMAAADQTVETRERLETYLSLIPASIQRSLKRPDDPTGRTAPPEFSLSSSLDLEAILPERLPSFRAGDRPPGVGDWELEELLGVGGFGEVWKARNPHLTSARPVALKFCLDSQSAMALRNEAHLLNRVAEQGRRHPGIVPLLHTYLNADPPCLEYEYVEGGDLAALIREFHRSPNGLGPRLVEQASLLIGQLAEAVAFAHSLTPPVVHRDLKPANIMVQRSARGKITLRVADFGIGGVASSLSLAKAHAGLTEGETLAAAVRGAYSPLYASRQQRQGCPPDPADDVFAIGVIWHQMLTGELARGCPSGTKWAQRLGVNGMSQDLIELLGACFEDETADRPATAGVLADRLMAIRRATRQSPSPTEQAEGPALSFSGHRHWVNSAVFSPDGRRILSGSSDKTLRLWDVATRQELRCFKGHTKTLRSVAFSPDGTLALSGGFDHTVRVWDVETGRQLNCLEGHVNDVTAVAFLPDGVLALSGSKDQSLRLWNVLTGEELECFVEEGAYIWSLATSHDGRLVLTNGRDGTVRVWDLQSEEDVSRFSGHQNQVFVVALSADGRFALSAGSDRIVHLWGVESGQEIAGFKGHTGSIWGVAFSPDGHLAVSCGFDKTVRAWELHTGREVARFTGHTGYVMSVAFSPDGKRVVSASRDKTLRVWGPVS